MSYIYIFYIHIVTMHAISISSTFYSLYTFLLYVHMYCNSSDYIIILYCFTLALMYPFVHLCTLSFIFTAPENIVVWRFINQ